MADLSFAITAVLPTFIIIVVGYYLNQKDILKTQFANGANELCFKVFFPINIFNSIYRNMTDIGDSLRLVSFMYVVTILIIIVFKWITPFFEKDPSKGMVIAQSMFRTNSLVLGISLVTNMFGPSGLGPTAILIATGLPMFNAGSIIVLSKYDRKIRRLQVIKSMFISLAKNPLVIASLLGVMVASLGIILPGPVEKAVQSLSGVAVTLALLGLGAIFDLKAVVNRIKYLINISLIKMMVLPGLILTAGILVGFRSVELGALIAIFATPTASVSYVMAEQAKADSQLAGQLVVITTVISAFTTFVVIYFVKSFGYL